MTKNDYVIICGGFGGIWDKNNEKMLQKRYRRKCLKWCCNATQYGNLFRGEFKTSKL